MFTWTRKCYKPTKTQEASSSSSSSSCCQFSSWKKTKKFIQRVICVAKTNNRKKDKSNSWKRANKEGKKIKKEREKKGGKKSIGSTIVRIDGSASLDSPSCLHTHTSRERCTSPKKLPCSYWPETARPKSTGIFWFEWFILFLFYVLLIFRSRRLFIFSFFFFLWKQTNKKYRTLVVILTRGRTSAWERVQSLSAVEQDWPVSGRSRRSYENRNHAPTKRPPLARLTSMWI